MKNIIGFSHEAEQPLTAPEAVSVPVSVPRKSVVQVFFPARPMTLAYYNDRFDLRVGDLVYVNGKLEGLIGRVVQVHYSFRLRRTDYKEVIARIDTDVRGTLFLAGSHFVTFDSTVIPAEKVLRWVKAPSDFSGEEEIIGSDDNLRITLEHPDPELIRPEIAERGNDYYRENRVLYFCLNGASGHAIVEGSRIYEVDFRYENGEICDPICDCYCSGVCKHIVAVLLQLRETLDFVRENYADVPHEGNYLAAIRTNTLFSFAFEGKTKGGFTLL